MILILLFYDIALKLSGQVSPMEFLSENDAPQQVLAGRGIDGGEVDQIWLDRLHIHGFADISLIGALLGTSATSIYVGSGPFPNDPPQAAKDCPFVHFGPYTHKTHPMATRGQGPGETTQPPSQDHYIVVAVGPCIIVGAPLMRADAIVAGFISAGIDVQRDVDGQGGNLIVGGVGQTTVGRFVQGLINSDTPASEFVYHRYDEVCVLPTRQARPDETTGWLQTMQGLALDEAKFASDLFLRTVSTVLSQRRVSLSSLTKRIEH